MLPHRLIKLGFHLLYNQMAFTYDWVAWCVSFGQWSAWRRLSLQYLHPGPTLELAYGTGGLFVDMLEAGYQPVGIDISPYMARLTRQKLRHQQLPLNINRAKAQSLPFPSGHFANVVATFPTDYIFQEDTLAEINRVLNSTGRLTIVIEGQLRGPSPIRPFIDWLYQITNQKGFPKGKPLDQLAQHNFNARWQTVWYDGASARLIIADKM